MTWWNTGYLFKKQINLAHGQVSGGADLSNYPALISMTDANLKTIANGGYVQNSSGFDIVFIDSTEATKLDHEIEHYVATTGEIEMWVRIPTLSHTADTIIYMYFNNVSISTSQENKTGVWDSNYLGVWHLKEDPSGTAPQMKDSTSNANNGTTEGSMTSGESVSAQIYNGLSFNGTSQDISVANSSALNLNSSFSFEMWIKFNATETQSFPSIVRKGSPGTVNGWLVYENKSVPCFSFKRNTIDKAMTSTGAPSSGALKHLCITYDGSSTLTGYFNGAQDKQWTGVSWGGSSSDTGTMLIANGDSFANIILDELRISSTNRSAGWITTNYNNQSAPGTFATVGTLIRIPGNFMINSDGMCSGIQPGGFS